MTIFSIVFVALISLGFSNLIECQNVQALEGQCVQYGHCGESDYGTLSCVYNGPPKEVTDAEGINILKQICPEYVDDDKAVTCCNLEQIEALDSNLKLPARLLGRCPSCYANFRRIFCQLTCSPHQSRYLKVVGTTKSDDQKDMITDLLYYMPDSFADGLFNSCRDVEGFNPGTRVVDVMCGSWGNDCNGERWLQFMGSTPDNQGFSPVQINFNVTKETEIKVGEETFYPMNLQSTKCNASPSAGEKVCECSDCPDACSKDTSSAPDS